MPGVTEGACPRVWEPFVGAFAQRQLQVPFLRKQPRAGPWDQPELRAMEHLCRVSLQELHFSSRFRGARSPLCPVALTSLQSPIPLCHHLGLLSPPPPRAPTRRTLCQVSLSQRACGSPAGHRGTSLASRWRGRCRRARRLRFTQVQSLHPK